MKRWLLLIITVLMLSTLWQLPAANNNNNAVYGYLDVLPYNIRCTAGSLRFIVKQDGSIEALNSQALARCAEAIASVLNHTDMANKKRYTEVALTGKIGDQRIHTKRPMFDKTQQTSYHTPGEIQQSILSVVEREVMGSK